MILVCVAAMHSVAPHKQLIQWLADSLRQGIALDQDVTAYMEATFGSTDLGALLADSDDTETDSLLELIFYPDVEAQLHYESRWGEQPFSREQQLEIESALCAMSMQVSLTQPGTDAHLSIQPPDFALAAYVHRLNITWQPKVTLAHAIDASWPAEGRLRARVLLRNANLAWHPGQVRLMERFFNRISAETDDADNLLPFLISLLPELKPGTDAFEFLIAKKFFYLQSLCGAEDFERKRQASNMETMMLQGNRSAHGSIDQWREQMRHIDNICRHLFGRTHFFQQPDSACIDLQEGDSGQNIKDIIRILS